MPKKQQGSTTFSFADAALLTERLLARVATSPGIDAYIPHESQEKFHKSTAKEKVYLGGNRSGKTTASSAEAVMRATGKHRFRDDLKKPPIKGRVVAVDIEDGIKKIVLPEISKWAPPSMLINGAWEDSYDKQSRTLTLSNNSFIEFMSYEQEVEKFAGTSRDFCYFDEEPPEDIFNECLMRLVDTDGDYWIAMTPLIEMSWVKEKIYDPWKKGEPGVFVLEVNTEENPHISIQALDRITRGLSKEEREARRAGQFINKTGYIYAGAFKDRLFLEGGNIVPDIIENLHAYTKGWGHFTCMDHGWANPTVFLFCAYNEKGQIIVYDEMYNTYKLVKDNADEYKQRVEALSIDPIYCVGDPSIQNRNGVTGTSVQSEYGESGVGIALGNNDVGAGITRVQNWLALNNLFISERCEETLKEIRNYRWDKYASNKLAGRKNAKDQPMKRNDHCMDALRYGVMSRPALEGEDFLEGELLLNLQSVSHEVDYGRMFHNPEADEVLGIEW